jgi:hypothetical protein
MKGQQKNHAAKEMPAVRQTESARVTTAKEARFRVPYPNSKPRAIKVIALDREAGQVVEEVSRTTATHAQFFKSMTFPRAPGVAGGDGNRLKAWLDDVAGHAKDLVDEIDSADSVVVIANAGADAAGASLVGETCQLRHKSMVGVVLRTPSTSDEGLSRTLLGLRPYTVMLVVISGPEYVEEMLTAMRA